jgi:hypothetical protein
VENQINAPIPVGLPVPLLGRTQSSENLRFMEIIVKQFLETPWYGSRRPLGTLLRNTLPVNEWHVT